LYYYDTRLTQSFDDVLVEVIKALEREGFSVLARVDVQAFLREKLGVEFRRYVILGACCPSLTYQALLTEDKIGTMLPCNVIVQEKEDGLIEVAAVDPVALVSTVENRETRNIAFQLRRVIIDVIRSL
jgi:uncharacterized protein (DUF302 family)